MSFLKWLQHTKYKHKNKHKYFVGTTLFSKLQTFSLLQIAQDCIALEKPFKLSVCFVGIIIIFSFVGFQSFV